MRLRPLAALAWALLLGVSIARAQDAAPRRRSHPSRCARDYARFSDGPRRIPRPRGASRGRAESLGLGKRRTAGRLLSGPPEPRWVRAARGAMPRRLSFPIEGGHIGRGFGFTRRVRRDLRHDGVDIAAPEGTVIRAVADGIVAYSDNGVRGYGNCVLIVHPDGWVSLYAHALRTTVQPGWRVRRGERIAFVGSTGIARGPHLHFELRHRGRLTDPAPLFVPRAERARAVTGSPEGTSRRAPGSRRVHARPATPRAWDGVDPPQTRYRGLGTRRLLRRLLRRPAPATLLAQAGGRRFRNLLWPTRGGRLRSSDRRSTVIAVPLDAPIRAAADGLVVWAGPARRGPGGEIVLLHRSGWVTVYASAARMDVRVGQRVLRGQWMGHVGHGRRGRGAAQAATLRFELWDGGRRRAARPLLVGEPG